MELRGRRECQACGTTWSYFETGTVECPSCGSVHSVGVDDGPVLHTAGDATLDLGPVLSALDDEPDFEIARRAKRACRAFLRAHGFVVAGDLQALTDRYLAIHELEHAADAYGDAATDDEAYYFLSLLDAADDGTRPDPSDVPRGLEPVRGAAYADGVGAYRRDARKWLTTRDDPEGNRVLGYLAEHEKRIDALGGDVDTGDAERFVRAAMDVDRYLRNDDENALATARERLDALGDYA